MSQIRVRGAIAEDVEFIAASNLAMASETEDKSLSGATLRRGVAAVIAEPRRGFYLLAERLLEGVGEAVGCLLVTYEWSDWRNGDFWWIQSVYVSPSARRTGVFANLYAEVRRRASAAEAVGIRLYVERENERAQATYRSLGMQRCHYHMYELALG